MTIKQPYALLTRPLAEAKKNQSQLQKLGIKSFIEPLLEISYVKEAQAEIHQAQNNIQAIIITSCNGALALRQALGQNVSFPVIAVGQATADAALDAGFSDINNAQSDVEGLTKYIIDNYSPENGNFIYASADITSGNLVDKLSNKGFSIENIITYKAKAINKLSDECVNLLKNNEFNLLLLYSRRTSKILVSLLEKYKLTSRLLNIPIFCLSNNVAQPLQNVDFKQVYVADCPNNESLLELISNFQFTCE